MKNLNKGKPPKLEKQQNTVPNVVFTPFKISKITIIIVNLITLISVLVYGWNVKFETTDLKEFAQFAMNIILVIGAIGVAIFAIPFNESETNSTRNKKEILIRYIGDMGMLVAITLLGYVLSIVGANLPIWAIKSYCLLMLIVLVNIITQTFASIVAHFNIS